MSYPIFRRLLHPDIQVRTPIRPGRLVIHSTANPGVSDENHFKWLDKARQHGWANYYLDWDSISAVVEEGMLAPAQGATANQDSISIELCEARTHLEFIEVWNRGVWLSADILFRYGWSMNDMQGHFEISRQYPQETDHTDPEPYFRRFGRTWANFKADVQVLLDSMRATYPEAAPWQYEAVKALQAQGLLNDLRHPRQTVEWWEMAFMIQRAIDAARK